MQKPGWRFVLPKVLISSSSAYTLGGMERVMQRLGRGLGKYGYETEVAIPKAHIAEEVQKWYEAHSASATASIELFNVSRSGFMRLAPLVRFFRARRPDIINVHSPGPQIPILEVLAAKLAGAATVTSIHGIEVSNVRRLIEQIKNAAVCAPLNHLVVAPSKLIFREQLAKNIPKRKIRLIPLGVEAPKLQSDRSIARSQLTISQGEFVIVTFARLVPHKGIDVLIEAVKLLPEDCRTRLKVFIGGIGNQREYEQLLNNSDRKIIHFVGHVDNTDRFYAAADLFVLPSRHEPFGLVFVEAAHYGVPSIGTRVGGVSEAIEDGHTGLIVPPESPGELSRAIERLIRNPTLLEKLGAAAQARARKFFSEEVMLGGYAKMYDEVLGLKKQNNRNQEHQMKQSTNPSVHRT